MPFAFSSRKFSGLSVHTAFHPEVLVGNAKMIAVENMVILQDIYETIIESSF